ncbi:MAG: hypothetical protein ACPL5F_05410 [Moorellaceae bacterium]
MKKSYLVLFLILWLALGLTVTAINSLGESQGSHGPVAGHVETDRH